MCCGGTVCVFQARERASAQKKKCKNAQRTDNLQKRCNWNFSWPKTTKTRLPRKFRKRASLAVNHNALALQHTAAARSRTHQHAVPGTGDPLCVHRSAVVWCRMRKQWASVFFLLRTIARTCHLQKRHESHSRGTEVSPSGVSALFCPTSHTPRVLATRPVHTRVPTRPPRVT